MGLARLHGAQRARHNLLVDGGELFARAGEEARNHGKAVGNRVGARGCERERRPLTGEAIVALGVRSVAPRLFGDSPGHVRQVLLDQRNFGHHRQLDVAQVGLRPPVRRHARENPRGSLLVHQSARAVNRIDDNAPFRIGLVRPFGQHNLPLDVALVQPLGDQHNRYVRRDFAGEEVDQPRLAHAVDGVNCVARLFFGDFGKLAQRRPLRLGDDGVADLLVESANGVEEVVDGGEHRVGISRDFQRGARGGGAEGCGEIKVVISSGCEKSFHGRPSDLWNSISRCR